MEMPMPMLAYLTFLVDEGTCLQLPKTHIRARAALQRNRLSVLPRRHADQGVEGQVPYFATCYVLVAFLDLGH